MSLVGQTQRRQGCNSSARRKAVIAGPGIDESFTRCLKNEITDDRDMAVAVQFGTNRIEAISVASVEHEAGSQLCAQVSRGFSDTR